MDFQTFVYHYVNAPLTRFPKIHSFIRAVYRATYEQTYLNPAYRLSHSLLIAQQQVRNKKISKIVIEKDFVWTTQGNLTLPYDPTSKTGYYPYSEKITSFADEQLFAALKSKTKSTPKIIFDVGANIGVTAIGFSNLFKDATVYAYEPVPTTFSVLQSAVIKNKLTKIVPQQLAIGSQPGTIYMTSDLNTGNYVVKSKTNNTIKVQVTTIDSQVEKLGKTPQIIKIDVEGLEWSVLLGARKTLQKHKPLLILELYEPWLNRFDTNAHQIVELLQSFGYEYYCVDTASSATTSLADDLKKNINFIFY